MPGVPRPKNIPGRPFKKPALPPSSLSSGAQQNLAQGLAWDFHVGRIFENIEKDIGTEARRYISFGGPSPVRGSAYIEELAGEIGLGRRQVPFYRMVDKGRAVVEVAEEPPATLAEALERKSRSEQDRQRQLLAEREELFSLAQNLNKNKKGKLTGEGWQDEEDQQRGFFNRKVRGQGKYQVQFTWGEVVNPADWSRLIEKNLESLAYQAVYYSVEGRKYGDLVSGGRTLSQEIADLLMVRRGLSKEIYDLDQNRIATGRRGSDGRPELIRPSELIKNHSHKELERDVGIFTREESSARRGLEVLEGRARRFEANRRQQIEAQKTQTEELQAQMRRLDEERQERFLEWQRLREEQKGLREGLGKEGSTLLSQDERLEREGRDLRHQRGDLLRERFQIQTQLKAAERKLIALNSRLTQQGLPPARVSQVLQGSAEASEAGRLKGELASHNQRLSSVRQREGEVSSRLSKGRQRLAELNPEFARVRTRLREIRGQGLAVQKRLRPLAKQRTSLYEARGRILKTVERAERARKFLERRRQAAELQLKAWEAGRRIATKRRVMERIDRRIEKFNPKMREWFAPRAKGQHLFNSYDWEEVNGKWVRRRKKSYGRFWQLQDFLNDPTSYAFRSFIWKGDPLPGGQKLFNVIKTAEGKFVTRWGWQAPRAGEKVIGGGLKTMLLGNDKMGPLMNVLKPGSPGAHLVNFATRGILDPKKYDLFRYFGQAAQSLAKRLSPIVKNLLANLIKFLTELLAKVLPKILGLLGTAGGGAAVGGAAGTAGAGAAGTAAAGGGLLAEEAGTALATGGTKPAVEATVLLVVGIILAIVAVIFLIVLFVVVIVGGALKDFGRGGSSNLTGDLVVVKTVDVLDINGNPTGSSRLAVDGADHNVRYTIKINNNSSYGASDVSLSDNLCGQVFTAAAVPAGVIGQVLGTCQTTVLADTDKLVINQVTGTAILNGSTINLAGSGIVIVGNPPDQPPSGWPIAAGCITQGPGGAASHRSTGSPAGNALDISPRTGAGWNVQATHEGIAHVYYSTPSVGVGPYPYFGYYVVLTSSSGVFSTVYAHLASINVIEGQSVSAGETLGVIDSTVGPGGSSTGNHLHYGLAGFLMDTPYIPDHVPPCVDDCAEVLNLNAGANCFTR